MSLLTRTKQSHIMRALVATGFNLAVLTSGCATTPDISSPTDHITLDKPVHFSAPNGNDVVAASGSYTIDQHDRTTLLFSSHEAIASTAPLIVAAIALPHEQPVESRVALSVPNGEDEHHVVLLLPDGKGLDAGGTYSGTRSRVITIPPLTKTQLNAAFLQQGPVIRDHRTIATERRPNDFDLAYFHGPIHYQDTDSSNYRADYITRFDYDGNMIAMDNWDNLTKFPLPAHAYYSVVETCTHWFIAYGFFHPRDWTDSNFDQEHENDMEGVLNIIRKDGTAYGRLEGMVTVAHEDFYSFTPPGSPLRNGHENIDGTLTLQQYESSWRPLTAQQAKGHGLKAFPFTSDFHGKQSEDGIIYFPSRTQAGIPQSGNDRHVNYLLLDLFAPGGLWQRQLDEAPLARDQAQTFAKWGTFKGDKSGGCGGGMSLHGLSIECATDSPHPPWGWDARPGAPHRSSPAKPGAVMTVRWEGSWPPSETNTDRPNASETLEITGFEPFLPDRAPDGRIFMYWTARCGKDPWLRASSTATGQRGSGSISPGQLNPFNNLSRVAKSDGCAPFGAYVPDDLRQAFPDIDKHSFPRTGTILSAADKRRLNAEYERVNPSYFSRMGIQPRPLSNALQAPIPPSTGIVPKPSAQLKIFSRGTETAESTQPETQGKQAPSVNVAPPSVPPLSEGMDDSPSLPPVVITFDGPLHFISTDGEDTPFNAGIYEIEPVLDLQLSLTREGESPVFLSTTRGTHSETIAHSIALLVPGESNDVRHVVFLTPDGKRFEAVGSKSAVRSCDVNALVALPGSKIRDAMMSASSGGPLPPCKQNSLPYGPRWIPVPCAMPAGMPGGLPAAPIPYVDGSNMLHACLNNNTGAFRIVRSFDNCGAKTKSNSNGNSLHDDRLAMALAQTPV